MKMVEFLWGNAGCCPPHRLFTPAVAEYQSLAGRYAIWLCKQLTAAPLHLELLAHVVVLRINLKCLHINPTATLINGAP